MHLPSGHFLSELTSQSQSHVAMHKADITFTGKTKHARFACVFTKPWLYGDGGFLRVSHWDKPPNDVKSTEQQNRGMCHGGFLIRVSQWEKPPNNNRGPLTGPLRAYNRHSYIR